jgi:hypothetical protein
MSPQQAELRCRPRIRAAAAALCATSLWLAVDCSTPGHSATAAAPRAASWSSGVSRICVHALLFEKRHRIGTRAGAVSVAVDIRASTARRLGKIHALRAAPAEPALAAEWVTLERRLAAAYARVYVEIYDVIAAAQTVRQRAREPEALAALVHRPDRLRSAAAALERRLRVPDCTGGANPPPTSPTATPARAARR